MRRIFFVLFFAAILAFPAGICAQEAARPAASAASRAEHGEKLHTAGLPNFGKINDRLYRGAQPRENGLPELKKLGVTTVVDLRGDDPRGIAREKKNAESLGMHFVNIPVSGWSPPTDAQVAQFLGIFREHPDEKVFVHCRLGDDRTGVFVAAYRMAFDKFLSDEALHEMYFFGFNGFWHPSMRAFIYDFPNRLASDPSLQPFKPSN